MKRHILLLALCLGATTTFAKSDPISLQMNKVCQIILPDKIEKFRGGFNPELFALDLYENILYIQCLTSFPDTNISIITIDSSCYLLDLVYTDNAPESAYIIRKEDRIYVGTPSTNTSAASAPPVMAENTPASKRKEQQIYQPTSAQKSDFAAILQQKDFIMSNNGIADKAMEVFLKGIYTHGDYIYFKIDIINNSELPYTYNYCGFAIVTKQQGKKISYERSDLIPIDSYVPSTTIEYKKTMTVIYKFEKFNYSNDRVLQIEMIEDNGERGLRFRITSSQLLKARKI